MSYALKELQKIQAKVTEEEITISKIPTILSKDSGLRKLMFKPPFFCFVVILMKEF